MVYFISIIGFSASCLISFYLGTLLSTVSNTLIANVFKYFIISDDITGTISFILGILAFIIPFSLPALFLYKFKFILRILAEKFNFSIFK